MVERKSKMGARARLGPASFGFSGLAGILFVVVVAIIFFTVFGNYSGSTTLLQMAGETFGLFAIVVFMVVFLSMIMGGGRRR
jgi:hypothetical protein